MANPRRDHARRQPAGAPAAQPARAKSGRRQPATVKPDGHRTDRRSADGQQAGVRKSESARPKPARAEAGTKTRVKPRQRQAARAAGTMSRPAVRTIEQLEPARTTGKAARLPGSFDALGVPRALIAELARQGIDRPFPIQAAAIPDGLAGHDILGRGKTGSGKTLAFGLPMLARLAAGRPATSGRPRGVILAPTRELAEQIHTTIKPLAAAMNLKTVTIFGGVGYGPQLSALKQGVDIVVACPGRLCDHIRSGAARLDAVEITVIDEADHMAELGFIDDVRGLLDLTPESGQRMLFSATLDRQVEVLVRHYLRNPEAHSMDSEQSPVAEMTHHIVRVRAQERTEVLTELAAAPGKSIIFTRTRRGASDLARALTSAGVTAVDLHGELSQRVRARNLAAFGDGRASTLVATDVAARGIHVDDVALVVHADPPHDSKTYLHRSGRTARAGARGTVVSVSTGQQDRLITGLLRKAGVRAEARLASPGAGVLLEIAPGERVRAPGPVTVDTALPGDGQRGHRPGRRSNRGQRPGQHRARRRAGR